MVLGGRFRVVREIGEGGTATVLLVYDLKLKKHFALKLLKSTNDATRNIKAYEIARKLHHSNIVKIIETGEIEGKLYVLTEFVDGKPLNLIINDLTYKEKLQIATHIIKALAHAHSQNILHKDLKPQNILIDRDKKAKLTDFGLARDENSTYTKTGEIAGTPMYISPEELKGEKPTKASDVFSVGVVLYELFTGKHPFKKETIAGTFYAILNKDPKEINRIERDVPERISRIISKCLLKDPAFRYKDAKELLEEWLSSGRVTLPMLKKARRTAYMATLSVLVLASILFVGFKRGAAQPERATIKGNVIKVLDKQGKELFHKALGSDITAYLIEDIDGDGKREVLAGTHFLRTDSNGNKIPGKDTARVYCFSRRGHLKWTYTPHKSIIYDKPDVFLVDKIIALRGENRVVLGFRAGKWFPYLIRMMHPETPNIPSSSFWNSGWVFNIMLKDINKDTTYDIVGAGVNNDLGMKPVVFALNGRDFHAQSPPWYGKEISEEHGVLFYTLLPGSDPVQEIQFTSRNNIKALTRTGKIYYLTENGILLDRDTFINNELSILKTQEHLLKSIKMAEELTRDNKQKDALKLINRTLDSIHFAFKRHLYPLYAYMYLYRGILESDLNMRGAIKDFEMAHTLDPDFAAPSMRTGFLYFKNLFFDRAARSFKESYRLNFDQWAYFYSMLSYALSGNYGEALRMHRNYAKKNDEFFLYFSSLLFYIAGEPDSALSYEITLNSRYPGVIEKVPYIRYAVYIDQKRINNIKDTTALKEYPDIYGSYLFVKGETEKAKDVLLNGLKDIHGEMSALSYIQLWRTHHYLYLIYLKEGNTEKAKREKNILNKIKIRQFI